MAQCADVADDHRDQRNRNPDRLPSVDGRAHGNVKEADDRAEGGGLRRNRHEGRDRRRRALVDVWRPLVERCQRGLEGEADCAHRNAGQEERIGCQAAGLDRGRDLVVAGLAGGAVEQRESVKHGCRTDRADDQVLQAGFERTFFAHAGRAEDVKRQRKQLEPNEGRDQITRSDEHEHAGRAQQHQREKFTVGNLIGRLIAPGEQRCDNSAAADHEHQDQRQRVKLQRSLDQHDRLAPERDHGSDRAAERRQRNQRHYLGANRARASEPNDQRENRAAEQHQQG